ncbi:hypothetical protein DBR32_13520 [Taibaiella sp. KBW10]|uniref:gliding motility-associated C-terminal domain-containing protein n=1 Tax=Taibaiella sp. KBW10 TaxID=2153357 RepID=UPI000F5A5006|nr:gliding motility-associated C-terminal domain-containing protein [Taibaiella sp. KBW10]RQO30571.1 hypothetical protein DBR32_13520 [Taibaiella sp. KBW10]
MKKLYTYLCICVLYFSFIAIPIHSLAQGENNNWHFGFGMGINFNVLPLAVQQSQLNVTESSAAVSDAQGQLLFYTMGCKIWDRNGVQMPNADNLLGNGPVYNGVPRGSGYRSTHIIKHPGNPNLYYVISGDANEDQTHKIYYSLVDMSLNNGLGDVVAGQKNIQFMSNGSEYLSVFRGNDCKSYWLIVRAETGQPRPIHAFKIDVNGFNTTPVITYPPPMNSGGYDEFLLLSDLSTAISANFNAVIKAKFDGSTGQFSSFQIIPNYVTGAGEPNGNYALSKDRSKLYIVESYSSNVYQYDVTLLNNPLAFRNSRTLAITGAGVWNRFTHMRAGPDGHLYLIRNGTSGGSPSSGIARMTNADQPVGNSVYDNNFLDYFQPWGTYNYSYMMLGMEVEVNPERDTIINSVKDTIVCFADKLQLSAYDHNAGYYIWNDGTQGMLKTVEQDGTYWVYSTDNCRTLIDSFHVTFTRFELKLPADTALCIGKSILVDVTQPNVNQYLWNDGDHNSIKNISHEGTYSVTATSGKCAISDTFKVSSIRPSVQILGNDTTICNNNLIDVKAVATPESDFTWNNGIQGDIIRPQQDGLYIVTATNTCGSYKDSIYIEVSDCICDIRMPNAFSPNGDGRNDIFKPVASMGCNFMAYTMYVYNRYGQIVFYADNVSKGWDGYFNGKPAEAGVYMYTVSYTDRYTKETKFMKGDVIVLR